MCFLALGGQGGVRNDDSGEHGGKRFRYGAFLVLSFNESISEYAWRTGGRIQVATKRYQ